MWHVHLFRVMPFLNASRHLTEYKPFKLTTTMSLVGNTPSPGQLIITVLLALWSVILIYWHILISRTPRKWFHAVLIASPVCDGCRLVLHALLLLLATTAAIFRSKCRFGFTSLMAVSCCFWRTPEDQTPPDGLFWIGLCHAFSHTDFGGLLDRVSAS